MQENENNLEVIDVTFTSDTHQIIPIEQVIHEEETSWIDKEQEESKFENFLKDEDESIKDEEESIKKDTSFRTYEKEQEAKCKKKQKGFLRRIKNLLVSAVSLILLFPILIGGIGIIGSGLAVSFGAMGLGVVGIVFTAFIMTVQSGLIGLLGIFVCIGLLSGGGLVLCLTILLIRGLKYILTTIRNRRLKAREV